MDTLVVLPTYNEAENVEPIVEALVASPVQPEVLVVDDGSPDGTADVVQRCAARHPGRVHLLQRREKSGLGGAYRAGFAWALRRPYGVIVQMDADGSHPPEALPVLVGALGPADVVIGSRYCLGGATRNWPRRRRALSRLGNAYARRALGLAQRDVTGGYRAWTARALRTLPLDQLRAAGYGFMIESALVAQARGLRMSEVPITFTDRLRGSSKMSGSIVVEAGRLVIELRRKQAHGELAGPGPAPMGGSVATARSTGW